MPDHPISHRPLFVLPALFALLLLAACAAGLDGPQRARLAGHELSMQYLQLHQRYLDLMQQLPEEGRQKLSRHVAPLLNSCKRSLATFNEAAVRWSRQGAQTPPPAGMEAELQEIGRLAARAAQLLQEVEHERH